MSFPYGVDVYIHPRALIHGSLKTGVRTYIWADAKVHDGVVLGDDCSVGEDVYIGKNTVCGDRVRIGQGAHVTDHMQIGRNVFISPHVVFSNDKNPRPLNPDFTMQAPVVEDDVSIGVNATILPGVTLGRGCVIGAGAVVTKSVPPGETWVGNPARPLR